MSDAWRLVTHCQRVPDAMGAAVTTVGSDGVDLKFNVVEQTESVAD